MQKVVAAVWVRQLESQFNLRAHSGDPQHYGIGIKEIWEVDPAKHEAGKVVHSFGWPLDSHTEGGGFLYHAKDNLVYCGFIIALNYSNPNLNPYKEFQPLETQPEDQSIPHRRQTYFLWRTCGK